MARGGRGDGKAWGARQAVIPELVVGGYEDLAEPTLEDGSDSNRSIVFLALTVLAARGR